MGPFTFFPSLEGGCLLAPAGGLAAAVKTACMSPPREALHPPGATIWDVHTVCPMTTFLALNSKPRPGELALGLLMGNSYSPKEASAKVVRSKREQGIKARAHAHTHCLLWLFSYLELCVRKKNIK